MKNRMLLRRSTIASARQKIKYVLLSAAVTGISFWVTGLLMTGNLMKSGDTLAAPALRIYPNPFNNSFSAEFESSVKKEVEITIRNMNGILIYKEKMVAEEGRNSYRFAAADFKQGTYIFRLSDSKMVLGSGKIICKKS